MENVAAATLPETLNGYRVVRTERHANVVTVMVEKADEYVVATWWPELGTTWMWGHYFNACYRTLEEARANAEKGFAEVARRNERR